MIVVTGGAGFIGSAIIWKLNQKGIDDILIVDKLRSGNKWENLRGKHFEDYVDKEEFLDRLEQNRFNGIETVIHMGACSSTTETDADYVMKNNYEYSKRLAQWSLKHGVKFIYASSAATYGDGRLGYSEDPAIIPELKPMNIYGYSKQLFDMWVLKHDLFNKFVGLKYFNVFGPNEYHKGDMMSVVCKAYKQISETGVLRLFKSYKKGYGDGEQKRDFVYVKDVVDVVWFFYQNQDKAGIFNVGTGQARTFLDLASATFDAMGKAPKIEYIDMPTGIRSKYQYFTEAALTNLRAAGYKKKFTSLEESVKDYVRNYLMNTANAHL